MRTRSKLRIALTVLLLPPGTASSSAQSLPALDEYHVRIFGVADGLANSDVQVLVQTTDGHIYAGSRGLARFNGYEFETVDLTGFKSSFLDRLHADRLGRLWILSISNDLGYIERGKLHTFPHQAVPLRRFSETRDGSIWIGSEGGLFRVRPGSARVDRFTSAHGLPDDSVAGVYDLSDGRRVAVTAAGLAVVQEDPSRATLRFEPLGVSFRDMRAVGSPMLLSSAGTPSESVYQDSAGLWIAFTEGVVRYRGGRFESYDRRTRPLRLSEFAWQAGAVPKPLWYFTAYIDDPVVLSRAELTGGARLKQGLLARDGSRWLSVNASGDSTDYLLRERSGVIQRFELGNYADVREVQRLLEDPEGGLWVGTDRGLIQFAPRRVFAMTRAHGLAEAFTTSVLQTRDSAVWIGTWGGGLHRYAGGRLDRRYTRANGLLYDKVRGLYEASDGTLWVALNGGIAALRDNRIVGGYDAGSELRSIAATPDGRLWAGGSRVLLFRTRQGWRQHRPEFWSARSIWALHTARDGSLWIGSDHGLFRMVGDSLHAYGARHGLRSSFVVSIYEEADGTLWFGTHEHGLHRFRDGRFAAITTEEGLHSNGIWRMLEDGRGGVWLSSDKGIARVDHRRLHGVADAAQEGVRPPAGLSPLVFRESEGMPSRECNRASPAGWRLPSGDLVFNNIAGVVVIDPARALAPSVPVPVILEMVEADGNVIDVTRGTARFDAGTKQLAFGFAALSFAAPEQTRYRYRLDGYDDEWVAGGTRRRASYTNLPPGNYTFRVQGVAGGSDWSSAQEASLAVIVPPLIWQTWWFRSLIVLAIAGMLAAAYTYRVRRLLAMQQLRLRIASDLHDDVGSNLSSISLLSEMLRGQALRRDEREEKQLERIGRAAEESMDALRDIIWLVNPRHDNLADLVQKMRQVAIDLLNGAACDFTTPSALAARPVDMEIIRSIYLIYKEALTNVAKHAQARRVEIRVDEDRGRFVLRIRDDGRGFDQDSVRLGHGIENMRRRAAQAGGRIEIVSAPARGTEIVFTARMA